MSNMKFKCVARRPGSARFLTNCRQWLTPLPACRTHPSPPPSLPRNSSGFSSLLKDGYKHFGGLEEAILKNIEACKGLAAITRTSLGPNGMNKLVVNHLEKLFVTSDAATIVDELEVVHPAAKMLAKAAHMQVQEVGDGSNFVITVAGELLAQAEGLLRIGVHPAEIVIGYKAALEKALEELPKLSQSTLANPRDKDALVVRGGALRPSRPCPAAPASASALTPRP